MSMWRNSEGERHEDLCFRRFERNAVKGIFRRGSHRYVEHGAGWRKGAAGRILRIQASIREKVTENEFDGTDSYAQTYTETNYDEDENIITIIVESTTRDYETNEITYGTKRVTDYTSNPSGDVTNYVYEDGDWILA